VIGRIEARWQGFAIQPDAMGARSLQPALGQQGGEFGIRGVTFRTQLQNEETLQCALAQLAPCPASTVRGTDSLTTGAAAFSITARAASMTASVAPSSTSNSSSSCT